MNIINQSVRLVNYTPAPLETIEQCGRVCYKSTTCAVPDHMKRIKTEEFVTNIIRRGHESVLEHVSFTFHIVTSRGVSHELVRHRTGIAFSQESTRYCNYNRSMNFIIPSEKIDMDEYIKSCQDIENLYRKWIDNGISPQNARVLLNHGLKTELFMTVNARELRHIFKLRLDYAAHPDMRFLMNLLVESIKDKEFFNVLFSDVVPVKKKGE